MNKKAKRETTMAVNIQYYFNDPAFIKGMKKDHPKVFEAILEDMKAEGRPEVCLMCAAYYLEAGIPGCTLGGEVGFLDRAIKCPLEGNTLVIRPHRGGLKESMAEARCFKTENKIKEYVARDMRDNWPGEKRFRKDRVTFGKNLGNDDRIGWKNVQYIMVETKEGNCVWGMKGELSNEQDDGKQQFSERRKPERQERQDRQTHTDNPGTV